MTSEHGEIDRVIYVRKKLLASINVSRATIATLKLLQEAIEDETGKSIGFNTLRRFFGLMPTGAPSFKTWSVFDQYLRSKRVLAFHDSDEFQQLWTPTHQLTALLARGNEAEVLDFLRLKHGMAAYSVLLGTAINHCLATQKVSMLEAIFNDAALFRKRDEFAHYLAEIVGSQLRSMPDATFSIFHPVFQLHEFRESISYWFIDYEHLNGYYGRLLEGFEPLHRAEDLFLRCILGYRDYLCGNAFPPVPNRKPAELRTYFPVLSGRYVGTLFLSGNHTANALWKTYVKPLCQHFPPHLFCFELIPALVLSKNYDVLKQVFHLHYEELYDLDDWGSRQTTNMYLIGEASLYLHEGDVKRAQLVHESIEIQRTSLAYYHYVMLLYCHLTLRLQSATKAPEKAIQQTKSLQTQSLEATGFKRFLQL